MLIILAIILNIYEKDVPNVMSHVLHEPLDLYALAVILAAVRKELLQMLPHSLTPQSSACAPCQVVAHLKVNINKAVHGFLLKWGNLGIS